jgi:hypothetical protein
MGPFFCCCAFDVAIVSLFLTERLTNSFNIELEDDELPAMPFSEMVFPLEILLNLKLRIRGW